jgi:hypothetical protein
MEELTLKIHINPWLPGGPWQVTAMSQDTRMDLVLLFKMLSMILSNVRLTSMETLNIPGHERKIEDHRLY